MPNELRVIAFLLPQFHPIPENDRWWGKGFTEWTNVTKARRYFVGHYQPHLPTDLGFYDLRLPEVREAQAELAAIHGIHGFCYHHYWFGGTRLLHRPVDEMLASGKPDYPFCLCWANENWSRAWDGQEQEVLIAQQHSEADSLAFLRHLLPFFDDHRYIRVNGAPLLIVYRKHLLANAAATAELWRNEYRLARNEELYLLAAETGSPAELRPDGFDAAVEFPPHHCRCTDISREVRLTEPSFCGRIFDYKQMAVSSLVRERPDYPLLRTVIPGWDNSPRRGQRGTIFVNSSPENYRVWLEGVLGQTLERNAGEQRIVFVNAWNEWAEGCHLEPDRRHGRRFLEATRDAIGEASRRQLA